MIEGGPAPLPQNRFEPDKRRRLGGPGMRTFLNIAEAWHLSEEDRLRILGFPARATYFNWVSKARKDQELLLPVDTLLRISAMLGIHKSLRILFNDANEELRWLRSPHDAPTFGGQAPMVLITSGSPDGIMLVRRYLDAFRGGTFAAPNAADKTPPLSDEDIVIV
ncbi:MAG: DUF2384 domain-containing protein [Rhodospirillaceae bacterium]|nr:MAG: DUF2384 domain-containing protein [Rhodospirillaceae bacterium]